MNLISEDQIDIFSMVFKGRTDVYAKKWEKNGKTGFSPSYSFNWDEFMDHKTKGGNIGNFTNKRILPLTRDIIKKHLMGAYLIGVYPLLTDNSSYFIAVDFDGSNWESEASDFLKICEEINLKAYIEKSSSGSGSHIWIFFKDKFPAFKSRAIIFKVIELSQGTDIFKNLSFDRLFPNQDFHSKMGFGNLIALPLNGMAINKGNCVFLDKRNFSVIDNQWEFLKNIEKVDCKELEILYKNLCLNKFKKLSTVEEKFVIHESTNVLKNNLRIILKNQIFLLKKEINLELSKFIKENLVFLNSEYLIKNKIGKSTYKIEKYFNMITEVGDTLAIPSGFLNRLIDYLNENNLNYEIIDKRIKHEKCMFDFKPKLYSYQSKVVEECKSKERGVIVAPPGSGKTIIGLALISEKQLPALIIVHRKQIFDQWVESIQSFLGINKLNIGRISSSKKKTEKKITVAMIQSLIKLKNIDDLLNKFGTIIIDECHHIPAKSYRSLISRFSSNYFYGLTATPERKYNDEKLIFTYIGDIIIQVNTEETAKKINYGVENKNKLNVSIKDTSLNIPFDFKVDDFSILSKMIIYDSSRNFLIVKDVLENLKEGRKCLLLTERKEHVDVLNLYLKNDYEIVTLTGDDAISTRKRKYDQIKRGDFQVIISTGQLFGEGTDINNLDSLFLVYPFSFEGKLIQYIGRIQRSETEKFLYDYRDIKIDFLEKLFKKREKYYKKLPRN
ncbi:MAG: TOTE conflict system archaeo-eukaryotic primase domain-containing protein [Candidatus Humimicrobiaceae bacterium]